MTAKYKTCENCQKNKAADEFNKNHKSKDGLTRLCKECLSGRRRDVKKKAKKQAAKKQAAKKPAIEKPDVESTPWPRAGDNKEFEEILGKDEPAKPKARTADSKEPESALITTKDVAEWIKWPFQVWSTSQGLPVIIKPEEALEIAEPLTRILNRYGLAEIIPPDVFDGMQVVGRTVPVIKRGNDFVRTERTRRATADNPGRKVTMNPTPQGAPQTKPVEK